MLNLTHNEDSAVDIGGVWTGPNEFELCFRLNTDDKEDINIYLILTREEVEMFANYLQQHLSHNKFKQ